MSGMSMFYLPEKLAMFIPAFAALELNTFGSPSARKRNMQHYLKNNIIPYFQNNCLKLREFLEETQVETIQKLAYEALDIGEKLEVGSDVLEDIELFYDAGHSFYGWNFKNLTDMRHLTEAERIAIEIFRKHLIRKVDEMYSFILPPEG
jgi:hypothetical protein